jgi:hypothetical protein
VVWQSDCKALLSDGRRKYSKDKKLISACPVLDVAVQPGAKRTLLLRVNQPRKKKRKSQPDRICPVLASMEIDYLQHASDVDVQIGPLSALGPTHAPPGRLLTVPHHRGSGRSCSSLPLSCFVLRELAIIIVLCRGPYP